ncbi:MAG: helix-turn-helix domain-containing protein, partial [Catenulispora sp.]|nr:helix-turn-helix domain-containing protein [Catenulispora sp.]
MTGLKLRQADLAELAGISKATVSNILNRKAVPEVSTLDLLAGALGITGAAHAELHALRERADARVRRLDSYLEAARRAAQDHPYPGVLPGRLPPLATVYVRQHATLRSTAQAAGGDGASRQPAEQMLDVGRSWAVPGSLTSRTPVHVRQHVPLRPADMADGADSALRLPAEQVLNGASTCVLLAGPGGGKSSLLRSVCAHELDQWIRGSSCGSVPVLVNAAALADRPFAAALAAAVTSELAQYGLVEALPPAFFTISPQPDVTWLVLVDGLDEISDPDARCRTLQALSALVEGEHSGLYRFVVATRPLPDRELDWLGPNVPRYDLQPFVPNEIQHVACGWFRALAVPDADQVAEAFTEALTRSHLAELARIPLMISMLCQLHGKALDQPLPASRGQIYRDFIVLLHQHQHQAPPIGVADTDRTGLRRYGPAALAQAEHVLDHLPDLIAHLAAARHEGDLRPATAVVDAHPEAQRPRRVPAAEWQRFLRASLTRSGLLTARGDELEFLHQTLMEHLAACHATRDAGTTAKSLHEIFDQPRRYLYDSPTSAGIRPRIWLSRYWVPPPYRESFVGFLIDAAAEHDPALTARCLGRLASSRGGLHGCRFILHQARIGTAVPTAVVDAARAYCADLAVDRAMYSGVRVEAAQILAAIGDKRGRDLCAALADDSDQVDHLRLRAVETLIEVEDARGFDLCAALAANSTLSYGIRLASVTTLIEAGDARGAELCAALATEATAGGLNRV